MRIVVAGSHGLIGSALLPALRDGGHDVARLVRRAPTRPDEIGWDPDLGPPHPSDQRPQDVDAGPHPADQVVVGLVTGYCGNLDRDRRGEPVVVHLAAQPSEQLTHDLHVEDVGDFSDRRATLGEQRGSHQLQRAVLRAGHLDLTDQPRAAGHPEPFHRASVRGLPATLGI